MNKKIIETDRLLLRQMEQSDYDALREILCDEDVMYAYEGAFSDQEVQQWLLNQLDRYKNDGYGLYAVILKETGRMIGQCGLTNQPWNGKTYIEVGYLFQKAYWHIGYATEAAVACKKYAFDQLGAEEVVSIIRDTNTASQNVAIRNGMTPNDRGVKHYRGVDMPHILFKIDRPEYFDLAFRDDVKGDDALRESFNALTRQVFDFDFVSWFESGSWGDKYIPHVLVDKNGRVVSNVSANIMRFWSGGREKSYIQLGTVMTAPEYRKMGLNRYIMNKVLERYGVADGVYLFANDSAIEYYPKFGFRAIREYEYSMTPTGGGAYTLEQVDLTCEKARLSLYAAIEAVNQKGNPNDGLWMKDNMGLYRFWLDGSHGKDVYFLPEINAYAVLALEGDRLYIEQIISENKVDINRLAAAFGADIKSVSFGYTPMERESYLAKPHREEDCTLFILGEDLRSIEAKKLMFPALSHA